MVKIKKNRKIENNGRNKFQGGNKKSVSKNEGNLNANNSYHQISRLVKPTL